MAAHPPSVVGLAGILLLLGTTACQKLITSPGPPLVKQPNVVVGGMGRYDNLRSVKLRNPPLFEPQFIDRHWSGDVDAFEGATAWRTRCVLHPVRDGVLVPNMTADPNPALVCWTLPTSESQTQLAVVVEGRGMNGFVIFGSRKFEITPWSDNVGLIGALFRHDGKLIGAVITHHKCWKLAFADPMLADELKTPLLYAMSVLRMSDVHVPVPDSRNSQRCDDR